MSEPRHVSVTSYHHPPSTCWGSDFYCTFNLLLVFKHKCIDYGCAFVGKEIDSVLILFKIIFIYFIKGT